MDMNYIEFDYRIKGHKYVLEFIEKYNIPIGETMKEGLIKGNRYFYMYWSGKTLEGNRNSIYEEVSFEEFFNLKKYIWI